MQITAGGGFLEAGISHYWSLDSGTLGHWREALQGGANFAALTRLSIRSETKKFFRLTPCVVARGWYARNGLVAHWRVSGAVACSCAKSLHFKAEDHIRPAARPACGMVLSTAAANLNARRNFHRAAPLTVRSPGLYCAPFDRDAAVHKALGGKSKEKVENRVDGAALLAILRAP
jgi:hypothetical protein